MFPHTDKKIISDNIYGNVLCSVQRKGQRLSFSYAHNLWPIWDWIWASEAQPSLFLQRHSTLHWYCAHLGKRCTIGATLNVTGIYVPKTLTTSSLVMPLTSLARYTHSMNNASQVLLVLKRCLWKELPD